MRKSIAILSMAVALASGSAMADQRTLEALELGGIEMSEAVKTQVLNAKSNAELFEAIKAALQAAMDAATDNAAAEAVKTQLLAVILADPALEFTRDQVAQLTIVTRTSGSIGSSSTRTVSSTLNAPGASGSANY